MLFRDQVAVVTGANGGIGRAIALGLNSEGAVIRLVGRNADGLRSVAACARAAPVFCDELDIADDQALRGLALKIRLECGRVDILAHCAGFISLGEVANAAVEDFDEQYRANLRAPFVVTQALLPLLRESRGQVVFLNSTAGLVGRGRRSQYSASKHGLKGLADSLRDEVNADGVRVLSLFLGRTATAMQEKVARLERAAYEPEKLIQPADIAAMVISALALPRTAEVTDILMRPLCPPAARSVSA